MEYHKKYPSEDLTVAVSSHVTLYDEFQCMEFQFHCLHSSCM